MDIAQKSGELLNSVVPNIQKTSDLVQEISASSIEQNAGAEQVNNAIQQLNQVVQANAATAEEMAAGAEELNTQAESLKEIISFFKTGESDSQYESSARSSKIKSNPTKSFKNQVTPSKFKKNKLEFNLNNSLVTDEQYEKF